MVKGTEFHATSNDELCQCEYCKTEIAWNGADEQYGSIWSCEKCGHYFCEMCFKAKHGLETAHEMFSGEGAIDEMLCPGCYKDHSI